MKKALPLILAGCFAMAGICPWRRPAGRVSGRRRLRCAVRRRACRAGRRSGKAAAGPFRVAADHRLSASTTWNDVDTTRRVAGATTNTQYNSNGWTVQLTQPLFRWQNWVGYTQSELAVAQAEAQFVAGPPGTDRACRPGLFRCPAGAGRAGDGQAQKWRSPSSSNRPSAISRSAPRPLPTRTKPRRAYDLTSAQEIAADNDLAVKRQVLRSVIGKEPEGLKNLRKPGVQLAGPQPADIGKWVELAEAGSASVQIYQALSEIAQREVEKQRAGHYPTLDLVATHGERQRQQHTPGGTTARAAPSACSCRFPCSPAARPFPRIAKPLP
jgi:outer membrane protein